jgi:hypothetical protein
MKLAFHLALSVTFAIANAFGGSKGISPDQCINPPDAPMKPACDSALEQSPADITKGSVGLRDPVGTLHRDYDEAGMCLVNVHWHLGAEHKSDGEYDLDGDEFMAQYESGSDRRLLAKNAQPGWFCQGYDAEDPKYTTKYDWKFCEGMHVGLTYEVHWPHSTAGHCGHLTDGLGGVFCTSHSPQAIGVEAQVFVIVNDDAYDVTNLVSGMKTDWSSKNGFTTDIAKYTGSTTGPSHDNDVCSPFGGISWHVDRMCHLVSAKSFDEMCMAMAAQGMTKDLHPHGSRELVSPQWVSSVEMER